MLGVCPCDESCTCAHPPSRWGRGEGGSHHFHAAWGRRSAQPVKSRPGPLHSSRLWACIYCPLGKCHQGEGCPGGWEERQSPLVGCPYRTPFLESWCQGGKRKLEAVTIHLRGEIRDCACSQHAIVLGQQKSGECEERAQGSHSLVTGLNSRFRRHARAPSLPPLTPLMSLKFLAAEWCSFKAGVEDPPPKVASSLVVRALLWDVGDMGLNPSG